VKAELIEEIAVLLPFTKMISYLTSESSDDLLVLADVIVVTTMCQCSRLLTVSNKVFSRQTFRLSRSFKRSLAPFVKF